MKLKIIALTPVHIGNGEVLSPYGDYIKSGDYIYILDYTRLEEFIRDAENSNKIIDEFVEIINKQASSNKSVRYTIKDFFINNDLKVENFSSVKVKIIGKVNNEEISQTLKTTNRPIIPGSTIKGAIRTALLYNHLKEDGYKLNKMKKGYIGGDIFGKYGDDKMKYLHVSDSSPLDPESVVILNTHRWNLKNKKTTIPITREAINSGNEISIHINLKAKKINSRLNYLKESNENMIFKMVNQYSRDNLKKEIDILKSNNKGKLDNLISIYNDIFNEIEKSEKSADTMIFRVGAGKTYFDNTVANLFSDKDLKEVREEAELGDGSPFPVTRTMVTDGSQVLNALGWIKLTRV